MYSIKKSEVTVNSGKATMLNVAFGQPASNDQIVLAAVTALAELQLVGGKLLLVNGPASLPVAFALAHGVGHIFGAVGIFDPKLSGYVVSVSHDPDFPVGSIIPASSVS